MKYLLWRGINISTEIHVKMIPTQRKHDAIASLWRQNDVATSFIRHNDVINASCARWESKIFPNEDHDIMVLFVCLFDIGLFNLYEWKCHCWIFEATDTDCFTILAWWELDFQWGTNNDRVSSGQGKVREIPDLAKVREKSGNFVEGQGKN